MKEVLKMTVKKHVDAFNKMEESRRTLYFSNMITDTENNKIYIKILKYALKYNVALKDGWSNKDVDITEKIKQLKRK